MLNKLLNMVKDAHKGMCIQVEYYHVVDCVIKIWKSPAYIELGEKPLIEVQSDIDIAAMQAIVMLDAYLELTAKEQSEIDTLRLDIKTNKGNSIWD